MKPDRARELVKEFWAAMKRSSISPDEALEIALLAAADEERRAAGKDAARLDWLAEHSVSVAVPLRYGSSHLFSVAPDLEEKRSDLRARIDRAMNNDRIL